ncbi:hypothetical protein SZ64_10855 [Erythrobacter sp. SG61-1L]|uniref:hypothetical protein n=1 Tax=Erythrobacter sp. SG61-1L TaxID=1603897 RepID=UPI0006C8EC28|nr:hypothetical protein [Erythrobacter sp. SG61-1L]KPL68560.1 hypothetical protein SZ64_10855 [Erythrobacter sp. SG61-1L]
MTKFPALFGAATALALTALGGTAQAGEMSDAAIDGYNRRLEDVKADRAGMLREVELMRAAPTKEEVCQHIETMLDYGWDALASLSLMMQSATAYDDQQAYDQAWNANEEMEDQMDRIIELRNKTCR